MPEYLERYVEIEDVKNNPFIGRKPDSSELPDYEKNKNLLPEPFWDGHEDSISAYYKAWKIAFSNLGKPTEENGFVSAYIDAAFSGDIFMWDSCFMLMFGKYGDSVFNFQRTLDNFYCKQEPDGFIGRQYHEDNGNSKFFRLDPVSTGPEIMAWCEWQYYKCYGDKKRLADVYYPLLGYHKWMKNYHRWQNGSYWSTGWGCGMDNLPRHDMENVPDSYDWEIGTFHHSYMSWTDANFQAILSCENLIDIANELKITYGVEELKNERDFLINFTNEKMWDEKDKFYYDLRKNGEYFKVKCIAPYWALISGAVPDDRLDGFLSHLENKNEFKRLNRAPALSADETDFDSHGGYWNGGVWPPTEYMLISGLTKCGKHDMAHDIALNHYMNVLAVYNKTGTFWENYAPDFQEQGQPAGKDFVGWTGIVPITVFIEYILGITVEAEKKTVIWRVSNLERHGINKLAVGRNLTVDLECQRRNSADDKPVITVKCGEKINVKVIYGDGKSFEI
jgi:hypothetical protein